MSKNIYRVNKKSDVDIIFKNNLLKPIFLIFVNNKTDVKLVNEIEKTLLVLSKKNTYAVTLLINFDKYTDEMNFFNQYKNNTPSFISFFLGQQIAEFYDDSSKDKESNNFISIIVNIIEKIHLNYVSKLNTLFTNNLQPQPPQPPPPPQPTQQPLEHMQPQSPLPLEHIQPQPLEHMQPQPKQPLEQGHSIDHPQYDNGDDNDTDEIRLKKEKLKLLLKQKELLEIQKSK